MVPFPNDESLMVTGLDAWRYQNEQPFVIRDERLVKRLGVKELRWPPDFRERNADPVNCNIKIPTVRFPRWHYCPFCGSMEKTTYYRESLPECDQFQWPNGRVCSSQGKFRRKMIPERFVVVCPEGHIDDFPIAEWTHSGEQNAAYTYDPIHVESVEAQVALLQTCPEFIIHVHVGHIVLLQVQLQKEH